VYIKETTTPYPSTTPTPPKEGKGGERTVRYGDHKIFENVAFISDVNELDERLTVRQTIEYVKGIHPKWNQERAEKLLDIGELPMDLKVKKLSKGMKTKLYLLLTLSLDVDILLLDEPTIGLDIAFKKEFYNTILGEYFDQNKLIFISTHQIEEIEFLLQEIVILDEGKIIVHKDMEELKSEYSIVTLPIERSGELEAFNPKYKTKSLGTVSALLKAEDAMSIGTIDCTITRPQIAEIFLALTGGYHATD
jgi:ABC-2 type transport system ATP-binding protein